MTPSEHPTGPELQACHDGELEDTRSARIRAHCASCAACRGELEALASVAALLAADPDRAPVRPLWNAVRPGSRGPVPLGRMGWGLGLAACAAGIAAGLVFGPVDQATTAATAKSGWTETMTIWNGQATSPLLAVFENTGD